jgi:hypothetical protein
LPANWDTKLFEDPNGPKQTIEKISEFSAQTWSKFQPDAFVGLTNDNIAYSDTLSNYITFRVFGDVLKRAESSTSAILEGDDFDFEIKDKRKPEATLVDVSKTLTELKRLSSVWDELNTKWKELGGRPQFKKSVEGIQEKRAFVLDKVSDYLTKEQLKAKGFPFGPGSVSTDSEVITSRKRAVLWKETLDKSQSETKKSIPKDSLEKWEKIISEEWLSRFDRLVNDPDDILDYVVKTPWESENAFKNMLKNDAEYEKAKAAAGIYRIWKIDGQLLDPGDPKATVTVNAANAFVVEVRKDDSHPPATIKTALRADGWTIISMLDRADRRSKGPPYFVPIEVAESSGEPPATVWFFIQPVRSRH